MTKCTHQSCGKDKRVWLPDDLYFGSDVKLHPWCINCGVVKNISDDRGHKIGYWMNVLTRISNRYSLKQVQKRCIAKELTSHECFNDSYFINCSMQKKIFTSIVKNYSNINFKSLEPFIY